MVAERPPAVVLTRGGLALAGDPVAMAAAMKLGVQAGRLAFRTSRFPRRAHASPSSPTGGMIAAVTDAGRTA